MIVVTGTLGFIGSQVLQALLRRCDASSLVAVDHPFQEAKARNRAIVSSVRFLEHDAFLNALHSRQLCPEIIVHLGACSSTTESDWSFLKQNNLEYSQELWRWCAENSRRFVYASSAATYGDGTRGFDDERDIGELQPLNLYGKSKHDFDLWVQHQEHSGAKQPRQCVGLKFFNVFGPGEGHKGRMASMVYHSYNQIRSTEKVRLFKSHRPDYPDGGQLRDFIYVNQVVEVILQCVENPSIKGLFNLGTGKARGFRDLAIAVFASLRLEPVIEYIPMPDDLKGKYQYFTQAIMTKAARNGLRVPEMSLEDAVADYVSWLENTHAPAPETA
jgi:ADP-L-glycero-D-manno-heptose 6-epimerase